MYILPKLVFGLVHLIDAGSWFDTFLRSPLLELVEKCHDINHFILLFLPGLFARSFRQVGLLDVKIEHIHTKTIGSRKRDRAQGSTRGINTTLENLQIAKHKPDRWMEQTPLWFVPFDLQIFSGGVYPPSGTLHTISFSTSNSFWY